MLRYLTVLLALAALASPARAADCAAPAWAPMPPLGYVIGSCSDNTWAQLELPLPEGARTVAGHRSTVTYQLEDEAKNLSAADARDHYIAQGRKSGAQLMTAPDDNDALFSAKAKDGGEAWYLYEHGSGNADTTASFTLTTLQVAPLAQEVAARPMAGPLDVTSKACADPPWLVKQFAYFQRSRCEKKGWDSLSVDLVDGPRQLEGSRLTVAYELTDEAKNPVALAVGQNVVQALQAAGAKLVSDPERIGDGAVLSAGNTWFIYVHGSGNSESTITYGLTTLVETPFPQAVEARAMPPEGLQAPGRTCGNPPWVVRQFDYFRPDRCDWRDFDSVTLDLPEGERTIAGRVLATTFTLGDEVRDPTALYVARNWLNALPATGGSIVSKPDDTHTIIATASAGGAEYWFIYEHGSGNDQSTISYTLTTIQVGGPPPKACTIEVYGVTFDFDKATLKPESEPVLTQVLGLFTGDGGFAAEIGGHTDNVGAAAYNLKLSDARAAAVKAWLVGHGVAAARVSAKGYGDTKPLVPNSSDENRAKNRRVELKRPRCTG